MKRVAMRDGGRRFLKIIRIAAFCLACVLFAVGAHAAGVTIVTHGWNPSEGAPLWLDSLLDAIAERHLDGEKNYGKITVSSSAAGLQAVCDPWNVDATQGSRAEMLIALDWSAVANHLTGGPTAQAVAAAVLKTIVAGQNGRRPLAELPIHLVGHSRGGGLVCELARLLGEEGIVVDHLTPLDPHPLTTNDAQIPFFPVIDTPTAIHENVLFADVYAQTADYPQGETIAGAFNRVLGAIPGGYFDSDAPFANHRNIYLMYQGTIDLTNPVSNREATMEAAERSAWFSQEEEGGGRTGFFFGRIKNPAARDTSGLHTALGGSGARSDLSWKNAVWPNVADLQILHQGEILPGGAVSVEHGAEIVFRYATLDYDSANEVSLHADVDRNPYNNNDLGVLIGPFQQAASGKSFVQREVVWNSSALPVGTKSWFYAKISDGTRTRYLYAPVQLLLRENSLQYAVAILRTLARLTPGMDIGEIPDVNGDARIGLAEAVFRLQKAADLR